MEQPAKPKLKAVVAPKESQAPKTELDPQLQHPEVQEKFKSIIDSVKGVREKVARLKADKMADSIERERESDKQKAKIKLAKALEDLQSFLEMLAKTVDDIRDPDERRADKGKKRWKNMTDIEQIKRRKQQLIGEPKSAQPSPEAEPNEDSTVNKTDAEPQPQYEERLGALHALRRAWDSEKNHPDYANNMAQIDKAIADHIKARPKGKAPWRSWQKIK
jgi:hypothetical protein